ncbi:NmrA family NAD(P)-binding protein [Lentzea sp. NBC_00516]|uniref:SDR family oxidoreductase n=1 Tax=Lentzea sp. NBC_00516 TaxID=2903582 RepID=UPI002E7FB4F7|nr:NmrA family NAD(P)-binding protein [Lentzea sp. NBC_00516]WUD28053.1 NmrA family NAD(P)-binding protein [Lentzea sp. NBC_00516]
MKILATGATGQYARLVVPALVERGLEVRAMVHDPGKADVPIANGAQEIVQADLDDPASLDKALKGVDGVFVITPAFHPRETELGLNVVEAAKRAEVSKIVYNGVYHPSLQLLNHATTRPVEHALYSSNLDFTVLQPAMYVQALAGTYRQALESGEVVLPWSMHSLFAYVDYRDVAQAAAIAFVSDLLSFGTFELAAGGMIDRPEIAQLMTKAAGRELVAADLPSSVDAAAGGPEGLATMFAQYDGHGFHGGNSLVLRSILGREPRSVADFIAELGESR